MLMAETDGSHTKLNNDMSYITMAGWQSFYLALLNSPSPYPFQTPPPALQTAGNDRLRTLCARDKYS